MSIPVAILRAISSCALTAPGELSQEKLFASFHCSAVRVSFQMEAPVDKQEKHKIAGRTSIVRSLGLRNIGTNNDLAALRSDLVREDIWRIGFSAKFFIERLRFLRGCKDEGHVPAGESESSCLCKRQTRRRAPREVSYRDARHGRYFLPRPLVRRAAGSILPSFTSSL